MQSLKRILVYIEPDDEATSPLRDALQLAEKHDADLELLSVVQKPLRDRFPFGKRKNDHEVLQNLKIETATRLETRIALLRACGVKVTVTVVVGKPWREIVRMALRDEHDIVMKSVALTRGVKRLLGSHIDRHLLRQCPSAVWFVTPSETKGYRRILVALDLDMKDKMKRDFNARLLQHGRAIADIEEAELHIVNAWTAFSDLKLQSHISTASSMQDYVERVQQGQHTQLRAFLARLQQNIPSECLHIVRGQPTFVIPQVVQEHGIDLVVVGTVGRSGWQGVLNGNTAERLRRYLDCDLLAVKPSGFISPSGTLSK